MSRDFFATSAIEWDDLPTVQRLLRAADEGPLLDALVKLETHYSLPPKPTPKQLRRALKKALTRLRDYKGVKPSQKRVIVPEQALSIDWETDQPTYQLTSTVLRRKDLPLVKQLLAEENPENVLDPMGGNPLFSTYEPLRGYNYIFAPAPKTLGYRVWMDDDLDPLSRYDLLAAIVHEMCWCGWNPKTQPRHAKARVKELDQSAEEFHQPRYRAIPSEVVFCDYFADRDARGHRALEKQQRDHLEQVLAPANHALRMRRIEQLARLDAMLDKGYWVEREADAGNV